MKYTEKTSERPTGELTRARQRIAELEELLTNEQRAVEAIWEAREYADSIVATVREPLLVLDADLRVVSANRSFYLMFRVKPEETQGRFIYDLGNQQWDIPKLREFLEEILPGNNSFYDFEVEHNFPALGNKVMVLNARQLYSEPQKTWLILLAIQDITVNKQAEERLSASETRYRRLFETAQDGILILDADTGRIVNVNPFLVDMLGYSNEEFLGERLWEIGPFKDTGLSQEAFRELQSKGYVRYEHLPLETKNGQQISVEFVSNVYPVNGDRVIQCNIRDITEHVRAEQELKNYRDRLEEIVKQRTAELEKTNRTLQEDITQRKKMEKALKESEGRFQALTENTSDLVWETDPNGVYTYINPKVKDLLGYDPQETVGKTPFDFMPEKEGGRAAKEFRNIARSQRSFARLENTNLCKDGRSIVLETSGVPFFYADGRLGGYRGIGRDITERKRLAALEIEASAAKLANQTKSDFLASMSHELRTPLNAVIGFAQVLQEQYFGQLNEKQAEYVNDILESGRHLVSLINDILDLSKIESGKETLEFSLVGIKELVESSLLMIREKVSKHGISLSVRAVRDVNGLKISADERKVKQIMFNLLSNAVKFTPDGGSITVEIRRQAEEIIISVLDTGVGIVPEQQRRLFQRFYQVHASSTDKTPGTGLGLVIAKELTIIQGGRIWVESEGPGRGSRFSFTLPVHRIAGEKGTER